MLEHIDLSDVYIVLCAKQNRSSVQEVLSNGKCCSKCNSQHSFDLDIEQLDEARNEEFRDSCSALGILPKNVLFPFAKQNELELNIDDSERLISFFLALCPSPSAQIITFAPRERNTNRGNP